MRCNLDFNKNANKTRAKVYRNTDARGRAIFNCAKIIHSIIWNGSRNTITCKLLRSFDFFLLSTLWTCAHFFYNPHGACVREWVSRAFALRLSVETELKYVCLCCNTHRFHRWLTCIIHTVMCFSFLSPSLTFFHSFDLSTTCSDFSLFHFIQSLFTITASTKRRRYPLLPSFFSYFCLMTFNNVVNKK